MHEKKREICSVTRTDLNQEKTTFPSIYTHCKATVSLWFIPALLAEQPDAVCSDRGGVPEELPGLRFLVFNAEVKAPSSTPNSLNPAGSVAFVTESIDAIRITRLLRSEAALGKLCQQSNAN